MAKRALLCLAAALLGLGAAGETLPVAPYGPSPIAVSRRGMAVAATPEAARAGAEVLAAGGNAVDAAVATAFALAVTYPQAGNLAGGGFSILRTADGRTYALDFRETAPAGTFRGTFLNPDGSPRRGSWRRGALAVGTPGTVRGLEVLHRNFGRLPWARLVAPAITLARDGFRVPRGLTAELAAESAVLNRYVETRRVFFPGGAPLAPGTFLKLPELAATLEAIAVGGADAFHAGPTAERIAAYVRSEGGVLTEDDLSGYAPVWRAPDEIDFDRWRIVTMPLPSAGGFILASALGQLPAVRADWRPRDSADAIHVIAEGERRAYADRNRFLGDSDCTDVPLVRLLAPRRLTALGASIEPARATPSSAIEGGAVPRETYQTTHLSTATAAGDAVSLTYTLNDTFGTGALVPGVGVLLNNEMDDFTTQPGVPNAYGLVQGEANTVRAGGRPLSSMTPAIVLEDGRPRFVLGSPGGSTIPTTILQVFLNAGPRGMPLAEAVSAPRFHQQHLPDEIELDRGAFPVALQDELRRKGHAVVERSPRKTGGTLGRVHAISFEKDGSLVGVADPRAYGAPAAPPDPLRSR